MANRHLYTIRITGRVQGVGFRWRALKEADALGITGFVENHSDGSVYIEAEGYPQQLDKFLDWCRNGPGRVDTVTFDSVPATGYTEFRIRH